MSLFQLRKDFLLFFSPGNRPVFISFLVFLLILPLLFSGCLAYSLDQKRHGSLPAVQAEGGNGDKNGVNNDEDINRQEEGLAERLAQEEEKRQALEERRKLEEKRKRNWVPFMFRCRPGRRRTRGKSAWNISDREYGGAFPLWGIVEYD